MPSQLIIAAVLLIVAALTATSYVLRPPANAPIPTKLTDKPATSQLSVTPAPSAFSTAGIELPPLYPSVQWEATKSTTTHLSKDGTQVVELPSSRSQSALLTIGGDLAHSIVNDFESYYHRELSKRGWKENVGSAAGGPTGEQTGYEKNGHYFLLGSDIVFSGGGQQGYPLGTRLFVQYSWPPSPTP